jgi:hypothetical protein
MLVIMNKSVSVKFLDVFMDKFVFLLVVEQFVMMNIILTIIHSEWFVITIAHN